MSEPIEFILNGKNVTSDRKANERLLDILRKILS